MSNISDLVYESRIANLEDALNLALSYLIRYEPGDSRAVSDEFVAMAAILNNFGSDYDGNCMPIIDKALEAMKQQKIIEDTKRIIDGNFSIVFLDKTPNGYQNVYVTTSEYPDETLG